ncbi:MAG TPA: Stp1/IreP family PP2C-type Ser/Thr phosphatase [Candidatus Cloacimonadota bacterium]|nr:Stp1/IreP family PP2C-type Ser/Thr phosphatase [Candidatus Cloacimonadota bacterium]HPT71984.1 Stp1/IreP family PP2C-type Ser/Thr phosphatase [Candidatus Cloacimonadota bacterium]
MNYVIEYCSGTDIGKVRSINQDAAGHFIVENGEVFIICDGIGGYAGGEIASRLVVDTFERSFPLISTLYSPEKALADMIEHANRSIREYCVKNPRFGNMGTTVVVLYIVKNHAYYAHVGDSRLYLIRNDKMKQLTNDHSLVQEMVDSGAITQEMAREHPSKNLITRGLGTPNHTPDIGKPVKLSYQDMFLLCTDGLTNPLPDWLILEKLRMTEFENICDVLVEEANLKGGDDNITVQTVRIKRYRD